MTEEFVAVLKKLIADRGMSVLDDAKICRSLLLDYGNEHKSEINFFVRALEKGFLERLRNSNNREIDKQQLAKRWHDDDFVDLAKAGEALNCLCNVIFGDAIISVAPTVIPVAKEIPLSENTFTDSRDGKVYRTVKIGSQIWMAENLNYDAPGSQCYDNNSNNAEKYGRLYDWNTAMKVVPPSWHLPSNDEWQTLVDFVGGYEVAGAKLKAKNGWSNYKGKSGNGVDEYDFSALPGGYNSNGTFYHVGYYGRWWSSNEDNSDSAYGCYMRHYLSGVPCVFYDKSELFSVRCVFGDAVADDETSRAEALLKRSVEYAEKGEYDLAIKDLTAAIKIKPDNPDYLGVRGILYCLDGKYDLAIADCETALRIDPNSDIADSIKEKLEAARIEVRKKNTKGKNTFTDPRDGKVYRTIKIGNQIWMAENLNYDVPGSKCYNNNQKNAEKYGRLYDWNTAMKVAPPGWHLPSDKEWQTLVDFVGAKVSGKKLKAKNGWNENGNGMDEYGFSALPGGSGYSGSSFDNVGYSGNWWSSSESYNSNAYSRGMNYYYSYVSRNLNDKSALLSVRYLKN